jgi:hypothetical protein
MSSITQNTSKIQILKNKLYDVVTSKIQILKNKLDGVVTCFEHEYYTTIEITSKQDF